MKPPRRIVSLACSNTEIVTALGCDDLLVGVDDHSDFPVSLVARLPRVGPDLDIDVDRVAALEPDLVLATLTVPGHERIVERLEAAGLPWIAPEPVSLDDVYRDIREIGARLGVPDRAETLIDGMRREMGPTPRREPPTEPGPAVVVQWWPKPTITPGGLSWTTDVLVRAGGRNPIGAEEVKSRPVSDEELAALDPDAIVLSWCGVDPSRYRPEVVLTNPALAGTRAVRNGHVFPIPEAYLGRPGPRLVEGLRALQRVVHTVLRASGADRLATPGPRLYPAGNRRPGGKRLGG